MILQGDCREVLRTMDAESVQTCVTSPPYWGLRDYGTATWDGGDPDCAHRVGGQVQDSKAKGAIVAGVRPGVDASRCLDCGAVRQDCQLGLEPTPEEYVANMVEVFCEVRRVLRPDGTLWLNLGDSYFGGGQRNQGNMDAQPKWAAKANRETVRRGEPDPRHGLKFKDLVGVPWAVARALQQPDFGCPRCAGESHAPRWAAVPPQFTDFEDGFRVCPTCSAVVIPEITSPGWWLRSDIIWSKPNPMPESVTDRPTKAHEYLFLLTKSERYFYDADAIAEKSTGLTGGASRTRKEMADNGDARFRTSAGLVAGAGRGETRNARTVWTIPTRPFPEAHFATFPPELARRCILAGSREGDTVLDPFGGSSTTGLVAQEYGRQWIAIELNPDYIEIAKRRTAQQTLWMGDVT